MTIRLKRVYEIPEAADGYRVLVERLWPRGLAKEHARLDRWEKDAGASHGLRTWYAHDPAKWEEFRRRYFNELRSQPDLLRDLGHMIRSHNTVTFLYAARDTGHNNAVALKDFLENEEAP